jgi:hypothetical protein
METFLLRILKYFINGQFVKPICQLSDSEKSYIHLIVFKVLANNQ